jgi:hypothetical protein
MVLATSTSAEALGLEARKDRANEFAEICRVQRRTEIRVGAQVGVELVHDTAKNRGAGRALKVVLQPLHHHRRYHA